MRFESLLVLISFKFKKRPNISGIRVVLIDFILFYFILFYFILFYFILFYFILFYFILFYFILFYFFYFLFFFIFIFAAKKHHHVLGINMVYIYTVNKANNI